MTCEYSTQCKAYHKQDKDCSGDGRKCPVYSYKYRLYNNIEPLLKTNSRQIGTNKSLLDNL